MDLNKTIRFGVMLDGCAVEQWQFDTVKLLIDNGIELALVIKNGDQSKPYKSFWDKVCRYPYRQILFRIWHRYWFKPAAKKHVSFNEGLSFRAPAGRGTPSTLTVMPIHKGPSTYFSPEDI